MNDIQPDKRCILIVDDIPTNIKVLSTILRKNNYDITFANNGNEALKVIEKKKPDLILLDILMPGMNGFETCRKLKTSPKFAKIPVIFVTALNDINDESMGFEAGGVDYITKPVSAPIVLARIATHLSLYDQQKECEKLVYRRTRELNKSQTSAIYMLGLAGHFADNETGTHIWRMAKYASILAKKVGWNIIKSTELELAATMHDTGKIGIPDSILSKPGPLNTDEWATMKAHCEVGYTILSKCDTSLFTLAADIALHHHEKWDGSGYPTGLKGKDIPESARIVAIADVFDALTTKRPYKEAWMLEDAFNELIKIAGTHLDPQLVKCFIEAKIEIIQNKIATHERLDLRFGLKKILN